MTQRSDAHTSIEKEVETLCKEYTSIFKDCVTGRYPNVVFIDNFEDADKTLAWQSLGNCVATKQVAEITSSMLLIATTINKVQISDALIETNSPN